MNEQILSEIILNLDDQDIQNFGESLKDSSLYPIFVKIVNDAGFWKKYFQPKINLDQISLLDIFKGYIESTYKQVDFYINYLDIEYQTDSGVRTGILIFDNVIANDILSVLSIDLDQIKSHMEPWTMENNIKIFSEYRDYSMVFYDLNGKEMELLISVKQLREFIKKLLDYQIPIYNTLNQQILPKN